MNEEFVTNEYDEYDEEWGVTMTLTISMQICDEPSWEAACEYLKNEVLSAKYPFREYSPEIEFKA
tara:strand:- start:12 stop:206 length:195 start_codon:yes stop_codon:yes gene_type:complete